MNRWHHPSLLDQSRFLPLQEPSAESLALRFTDPRGVMVEEVRLPIGAEQCRTTSAAQVTTPRLTETAYEWSDEDTAIRIDRSTGRLSVEGVLQGGPHLMLLAINGDGGTQMMGADDYPAFTAVCADWIVTGVDMEGNEVVICGVYAEAEGAYRICCVGTDELRVSYSFRCKVEMNPRQVGIVFDLPRSFDTLRWQRNGLWTYYPADHIGRIDGNAKAFMGVPEVGTAGCATEPTWPWSHDGNALGCHDFRSTKRNILSASLTNDDGRKVTVLSDGTQHVRTWVDDDRIRLLAAEYDNPGGERFFRRHASSQDRPLRPGDKIEGAVHLTITHNATSRPPIGDVR